MPKEAGAALERYASIDIGSNTIKLLIAERDSLGAFRPVLEAAAPTRLGEGIHAKRLRETAIRRTLDALGVFSTHCKEHQATRMAAVGTSALRDAANRDEFISRAAAQGVDIEAISGDEEARLSFSAVSRDVLWKDAGPLLVIDIGGGSTEVIQGQDGHVERRISLPLGAVRLTEACLHSDPPTVREVDEACGRAREALEGAVVPPANYTAVGVGGTLANMAAVHISTPTPRTADLHGDILSMDAIDRQIELYAERTIEERKQIVGLNPTRADVILAGAIILREALNRLGRDSIAVSTRGLRWGLLYDRFG